MRWTLVCLACCIACLAALAISSPAISEEKPSPDQIRTKDSAWRAIERLIEQEDVAELERRLDADPALVATVSVFRGKGDVRHETLLHFAASYGKLETVKLLLTRGANVNARAVHWHDRPLADSRQTPLHRAVRSSHLEVARVLLDSGADVNAKMKDGTTPLHDAMWKCRPELVNLLLARGADIDARKESGMTSLHAALWSAPREIADILAARGAKQDVFAAAGLGNIRLLELLLQEDPGHANARTGDRDTPLHFAAATGEIAAAKILLAWGAAIGAQSGEFWNAAGNSPLHVAADRGHLPMCRLLVEAGADLNKYGMGETPLHAAISTGRSNVVEYLVDQGSDIHRRDLFFGHTALHAAASSGHVKIVDFLLRRGAHLNCPAAPGPLSLTFQNYARTREESHRTPLDIAITQRHFETARFLQDRGGRISAVDDDARKAFEQSKSSEKPGF